MSKVFTFETVWPLSALALTIWAASVTGVFHKTDRRAFGGLPGVHAYIDDMWILESSKTNTTKRCVRHYR